MIDFILKHWVLIIVVLTAIFEIAASLVVIIKEPKNKRLQKVQEMFSKIPSFINQAEACLTGASQKKVFVVKRCINFLADALGWKECKVEKLYLSDISNAIEDTLSTPQKKG